MNPESATTWDEFMEGIWRQNPVFVMVLGMCPTLAVTVSGINALSMGVATTFVLVCSCALVSLMRSFTPKEVRIAVYIVIIATFVTVVDYAIQAISLALYQRGHDLAARAGMILADTKFEFGTDDTGRLHLIDEALTPDSSRYWPAESYAPDQSPPSYDKQFVRDHLLSLRWNQQPPAPRLPVDVITRTRDKYLTAVRKLVDPR